MIRMDRAILLTTVDGVRRSSILVYQQKNRPLDNDIERYHTCLKKQIATLNNLLIFLESARLSR